MGLRFQKPIRFFKSVTLNLNKAGPNVSLGGRGASVSTAEEKYSPFDGQLEIQ